MRVHKNRIKSHEDSTTPRIINEKPEKVMNKEEEEEKSRS